MISHPAVVVHGLGQAAMALAPGRPVALLSAPGAACFAGAGWWRALIAAARAAHPATESVDILDCADAAGRALEALRIGQEWLILAADCPGFAAVAGVAAACGAHLVVQRPPALDLAVRGAARHLDRWLAAGVDAADPAKEP